jgi:hypothetical protein
MSCEGLIAAVDIFFQVSSTSRTVGMRDYHPSLFIIFSWQWVLQTEMDEKERQKSRDNV